MVFNTYLYYEIQHIFNNSFFLSCQVIKKDNFSKDELKNDSIEKEFLILKKNIFIDYYRFLYNGKLCDINDVSSYIQISNLDPHYFSNNKTDKIMKDFSKKKYNSYFGDEKNLNLMKSLDFYESNELNRYIDSLKIIEYKKIPK